MLPSVGSPPLNMTPFGAGRGEAFNDAKGQSCVHVSQNPVYVGSNVNRQGQRMPGRVYYYVVPASGRGSRIEVIRDDAGGHSFGRNNPQNRGPHFNDTGNNHYDY